MINDVDSESNKARVSTDGARCTDFTSLSLSVAEYQRDLEEDLLTETSGGFSQLLVALLKVRREIPHNIP